MNELPKVARRSPEQKALGYLNAAREGVQNAQRALPAQHRAQRRLSALVTRINIEERYLREAEPETREPGEWN